MIPVIPTLLVYLTPTASIFSPLRIIAGIASFVLSIMASGAYPSIVKAVLDGAPFSMTEALGKAYHKFWTLFAAGLLVGLIVILGAIALVVPGIIFGTWYAYTVPAIMLEDKGALEGMSASKAFGRDKKWSTFLIFLVLVVVEVIIAVLELTPLFFSPLLGQLTNTLLMIPFAAWSSVLLAYTYLSYGPSSVPVIPGTPGFGGPGPTATQQPPPIQPYTSAGGSAPNRFCASCGSPIQANSRFCSNCGKAV